MNVNDWNFVMIKEFFYFQLARKLPPIRNKKIGKRKRNYHEYANRS